MSRRPRRAAPFRDHLGGVDLQGVMQHIKAKPCTRASGNCPFPLRRHAGDQQAGSGNCTAPAGQSCLTQSTHQHGRTGGEQQAAKAE